MKRFVLSVIIILFAFNFVPAQKKAFTIDDLYRVKNVGSPVVSPNNDFVAYTISSYKLKEGESNTSLFLKRTDGSETIKISGDENWYHPFWKNDNVLLYQKDGQVYSYNLESEKSKQLTDFSMGISDPIISPDGKYILFTSSIFPECGIDNECNKKLNKSYTEGPVQAYMADDLLFRHWTEYAGPKETHLILYDVESESYKDLAHSEWLSGAFMLGGGVKYNFSPDGKEICFIKNPDEDLASSTNTDLYIISVEGGKPENLTKQNQAWDGYPVFSPNGRYIAFKLQKIVDYEADRYRIALYDRDSKETTILTEDFDYTINAIQWSDDSNTIFFTADYEGYSPLYSVNIVTKEITELSGKQSIFSFDYADELNEIFYRSSAIAKPLELFRINTKDKVYDQFTNVNKEFLEEVDVRSDEQLWIEGADGKKVQVFLVKPHNFDSTKKYPLILNVHGGPQGQWMDSFRGDWQVYPGAGYVLAFPNPHGSTGFGSEYTEQISGDWGGKVFEDLMKVTDELEKLSYIDKERVGAMGWSFGGYMMNWFQAKTDRYKCLVSMMGIFDLESMWGATEELWFVNWDLKGYPWNSDVYDKYSPSEYVENFSTPTLIIAGEKDYRVPYTQSIQYFTTLQVLGIDSKLIIFPNDGHWPNHVKSMPLYYNALLEWFHKYLGGNPAPYNSESLIKNNAFE